MKYTIKHSTEYEYQEASNLSYNLAWMIPRATECQELYEVNFSLVPGSGKMHQQKDYFGNDVAFFYFQQPHNILRVMVESELERKTPSNVHRVSESATPWNDLSKEMIEFPVKFLELKNYTLPSPLVSYHEELRKYAQISFPVGRPMYEAVWELTQRIYEDFEYDPNYTTVSTPILKAFQGRKGVCQDFAHIAICCLRSIGLPARYVSGYIETLPPEGESLLVGSAASHAWFSAYIPELGWLDFDPTNIQMAKDQHIVVAWGRDYSDVPPLKGVIFNNSNHQLKVDVEVKRHD